jgi:hypothetical protein
MIPRELEMLFHEIRTPVIFATAGDEPHATPMNWDYDGYFWISPAGGSKKVRNMLRNKHVCIACVEGMRRNGRGFIFQGEIVSMETGFLAFLKHAFIMRNMLTKRSTIGVSLKLLRYAYIYARHPSVHYSALPWKRYFAKIRILKGKYWLRDGVEHEFTLRK